MAFRRGRVAPAWGNLRASRIDFVVERVRGRSVIDVGCVNHDVDSPISGEPSPGWLHGAIARAASSCVGLDVDAAAVDVLGDRGYDVRRFDVERDDIAVLAPLAPVDVVVAGEIIEHLDHPQRLFEVAKAVLRPDGELIITTPNPAAPSRVRAARFGIQHENVDHVALYFPSGIAELADRCGLRVALVATTDRRPPARGLAALRPLYRSALNLLTGGKGNVPLGRRWLYVTSPFEESLADCVRQWLWQAPTTGETSIYIIRR